MALTDTPPDCPEPAAYGPEHRALNVELDPRIIEALDRLRPKFRAAVVLEKTTEAPPS